MRTSCLSTYTFVLTFTGSSVLHSAVENWDHSAHDKGAVFCSYLLTNLSLALMSSILCVYFVPHAAGSGIPEVKAYLNGVRSMHKLASVRLLVVKIIGTILSVSSGLSVGQEGPLIHIGSILGASCTKFGGLLQNMLIRWNTRRNESWRRHYPREKSWSERLLSWTMQELSHFATDAERRDLVSIGASVGFAASFGSPVGGLLFILDDVSCYFERKLLLRMLIGNAIGTFFLAIKHRDFSNFGIINLGTFNPDQIFQTRLFETPLYALIGIGGGVLGGYFCAGYLWLQHNVVSRFPVAGEGRAKYQMFAVAVVSIVTSAVLFYLPTVSWACKSIPRNVPAAILADYEEQEKKRFFCEPDHVNEMATVAFGSRINTIKEILADPTSYQQRTLLAIGTVFYVLTLVTFGTCTMPLGLFTPTILVGASFGGACGNLFHQYIDENIFPSTFALLGVAAMLAGIQHSTVSAAVILVEGTGQIKVLLPVIVVVVISRYVAQNIQKLDVFEAGIMIKKLPYLEHEKIPRYFDAVTVKDLLGESSVLCLNKHETVGRLIRVLEDTTYCSFPVVDCGRFVGLVKRIQIAALLECGAFSKNKSDHSEDELFYRSDTSVNEDALAHWVYCINDDRYAHIISLPEEEIGKTNQVVAGSCVIDDHQGRPLYTKEQQSIRSSMRKSLGQRSTSFLNQPTQEFGTVNRNESGSIVVSHMDPEYNEYWVDLDAVANSKLAHNYICLQDDHSPSNSQIMASSWYLYGNRVLSSFESLFNV